MDGGGKESRKKDQFTNRKAKGAHFKSTNVYGFIYFVFLAVQQMFSIFYHVT